MLTYFLLDILPVNWHIRNTDDTFENKAISAVIPASKRICNSMQLMLNEEVARFANLWESEAR